jgi:hypothetical protein
MSDPRLALIHEKEAIERWFSLDQVRTHEENVAKHSRLAEIAAELERLSPKSPDTEIRELVQQLDFQTCSTPDEVLEITNRLKELREQKSNPEAKPLPTSAELQAQIKKLDSLYGDELTLNPQVDAERYRRLQQMRAQLAAMPNLADQYTVADTEVKKAQKTLELAKKKQRDLEFEVDYQEQQKHNQVKQWCRQLWEAARKADEKATEEQERRRVNARADKTPPAWFIEWVEFNSRQR